jgi:Flp pilus assembly protein TadD
MAQSLKSLGVAHRETGNLTAAEPLIRESLALQRRLLGPEDKEVAVTLVELSRVLQDRGRPEDAVPYAREALAIRRKVLGEDHRETSTSKSDLGLLLRDLGDLEGAERLFRENVATNERVLGPNHPNLSAAKGNLALVLNAKGDLEAAETLAREALEIERRTLGETHVGYAITLNNLAGTLEVQGRLPEAEPLFERALGIARAQFKPDHPIALVFSVNLSRVRIARGGGAATEGALRDALLARQKLYPGGDWRIAQAQSLLGAVLLSEGRNAEAEPLMLAADRVLKPIPGNQARERLANRARLAALYGKRGDPQRADAYR